MPPRGLTEYVIATAAISPMATGGSSATSRVKAVLSTVNFCGLPSRSTFFTSRSAASSESTASGARRDSNFSVTTPSIRSAAMSKRSSAL